MLTPARAATALVVKCERPSSLTSSRALARIRSTVACERCWEGRRLEVLAVVSVIFLLGSGIASSTTTTGADRTHEGHVESSGLQGSSSGSWGIVNEADFPVSQQVCANLAPAQYTSIYLVKELTWTPSTPADPS